MTIYLYDGPNSVEEVDCSGNVLARYTQPWKADELLAEVRSGTASYYEQDGLSSVSSLSNAAGALANSYAHDSFGKLTASTGTLTNPHSSTPGASLIPKLASTAIGIATTIRTSDVS